MSLKTHTHHGDDVRSHLKYIQSLLQVITSSLTSPHALYCSVLRWNFDVESADVILGHNVEYRGFMSRLPILVLECSKRGHPERGHAKED